MSASGGSLKLGRSLSGAERYLLLGRPIRGGDIVQLCASGGWLTGRFEWDPGCGGVPTFHFSVELEGGGVEQLEFPVPERALRKHKSELEAIVERLLEEETLERKALLELVRRSTTPDESAAES